jgi:YHS domain-containing protein
MKHILLAVLAALSSSYLNAQESEIFIKNGVAINGYDAVAFFDQSKPVKGSPEFPYPYKNATWLFASREHLDAFIKTPEHYEPQYGGYCAYGTSQGHKAPTQADTWTITNGKLYFNYNQQVKEMWSKNEGYYISLADEKWPSVKKSK